MPSTRASVVASWSVPIACALGGVGLGLVVGALREASLPTAALLLAEPAPAVVGICAVHLCFLRGRWGAGVGLAVGVSGFLLLSRVAPVWSVPWPAAAGEGVDAPALGACAASAEPPYSWILAQWTGADTASTVHALTDVADVVVLHAPAVDIDAALADVGGELRALPDGGAVWARAGFAACGAADAWPVGAGSTLLFPSPAAGQPVPLLVGAWPLLGGALEAEVGAVAAAAAGVGSPDLVVAADAALPTSYARTDVALADAGLRAFRLPPNAPAALGPLPLLTLRAVNRVWAGPAWTARGQTAPGGTALAAPMLVRFDYQVP